MTNAPTLCPHCLSASRIATTGGPTCTHQANSGVTWWPSWWDDATEARRTIWLQAKQDTNAQP